MSSKKIVAKKGQRVTLKCCSHDVGSDREETEVLEFDATHEDLDEMARMFMEDSLQPEWWYEVGGG